MFVTKSVLEQFFVGKARPTLSCYFLGFGQLYSSKEEIKLFEKRIDFLQFSSQIGNLKQVRSVRKDLHGIDEYRS